MLGTSLCERGDRDTGIIILKVALELFPESAMCWYILGELYFKYNQFELSIQAMQQSLKYDPTNNNVKVLIADAKKKLVI